MEQQDYLQRLIKQIGRLLGKISSDLLGLKNNGQIADGIEIMYQTLKGELDLDIRELIHIHNNDFIKTLATKKGFNNDNLNKLADILLLIAENRQEKNKRLLYEKSLIIYEHLEKAENVYSLIRQEKIELIKRHCN